MIILETIPCTVFTENSKPVFLSEQESFFKDHYNLKKL